MQASNGPLPISPWTCPHCHATWHSGRQYCVDCGYGVPVQNQAPWPAQVLEEAEMVRRFPPPESQGLRPEMVETNESALRRSLDAESALQAEVAVLRERTAQLQTRLDEQRRVFVTGVQQMMQPLHDYFTAQHLAVPFEALVPQALEQLGVLTQTVARFQADAQTRRPAEGVRPTAADLPQLSHLETLLAHVVARLDRLEDARADAVHSPTPDTFETFVMSDRQSAEIERALLDAQTRGRSFPG